jgi:hypothetical protein
MPLRANGRGRVLAHLDYLGRVDDRQQVFDAGQIALLSQGGADVVFAADELNLVTPRSRGGDSPRHRRQRRLIATHRIQRNTHHDSGIIHPNPMRLLAQVRAAAAATAKSASFVRIQTHAIEAYARSLPLARVRQPELDPATHYLGEPDATLTYLVALDAINFGSGYFPKMKKRPGLSGYFTVASSLKDCFERQGVLSAEQLRALTIRDCARIFDQDLGEDAMAELMALFCQALNDLGNFISATYGGSFRALVEAADGSAEKLAGSLAQMRFYQDVGFYKRAQLTAADLAVAEVAHFDDLERLTIFADNLVPHVLRMDDILEYDPELLARIEREELISAGSVEEREIRSCALHAVELIAQVFRGHGEAVTPMQLDYVLWNRGQEPAYKARPRHRTRTVFY